MKFAVVTGAGGFIGSNLVSRLKSEGYYVRGVDRHAPRFQNTVADEFRFGDLSDPETAQSALGLSKGGQAVDEVYQLAADMGGMGYIHSAATDILQNSTRINLNMVQAAVDHEVPRYFLASSVCVYRDLDIDAEILTEDDAYPAHPDNEYGWEKLYAERVLLSHAAKFGFEARIARFENCYGPQTVWEGGREKAPAALCRKAIDAKDGGALQVWGDGSAVRNFTYVSDLISGVRALMASDITEPTNVGSDERVTVDELAQAVIAASGKRLKIEHIDGPRGVQSRHFSHERLKSTGWEALVPLTAGIDNLYHWILRQIQNPVSETKDFGAVVTPVREGR